MPDLEAIRGEVAARLAHSADDCVLRPAVVEAIVAMRTKSDEEMLSNHLRWVCFFNNYPKCEIGSNSGGTTRIQNSRIARIPKNQWIDVQHLKSTLISEPEPIVVGASSKKKKSKESKHSKRQSAISRAYF